MASALAFAVTVRQHPLGAPGRGHFSLWKFLGGGRGRQGSNGGSPRATAAQTLCSSTLNSAGGAQEAWAWVGVVQGRSPCSSVAALGLDPGLRAPSALCTTTVGLPGRGWPAGPCPQPELLCGPCSGQHLPDWPWPPLLPRLQRPVLPPSLPLHPVHACLSPLLDRRLVFLFPQPLAQGSRQTGVIK